MEYHKVKSSGKDYLTQGVELEAKVVKTMGVVSKLVGATLGPGGHSVLLERQEHNLPNFVTKDGVTVFRSIGFRDPIAHAIMESARDASVRTANEAGDGTTTATILAYSIVNEISQYTNAHPGQSPQKIIRKLQAYFKDSIEPTIREHSIKCDFGTPEGKRLLWNVAKLSANGDAPLADAVLECFDLVGDKGNVTITEINGPSGYEVERIEGFPINSGYEDSCGRFYSRFVNDPGTQRVFLEKPIFLLYHGRVTDIQSIVMVMERIGMEWQSNGYNHNIVLVATGFSESVLAQLQANWVEPGTINVYPLISPMNAIPNSQFNFLEDLAAITGASIFDPINKPFPRTHEELDLEDLGPGLTSFEAHRFRSNIIGNASEDLILLRTDILEKQLEQAAGSILEETYLNERIGKLTGGIAKLKVIGVSNGELRERRDRAEDAIMAVRKATEYGCLPGGGWMLLKLVDDIQRTGDKELMEVLGNAFLEPVFVLFSNLGFTPVEANEQFILPITRALNGEPEIIRMVKTRSKKPKFWQRIGMIDPGNEHYVDVEELPVRSKLTVYDAQEHKFVDAIEGGILDSTPAVLEAIRNSLSIATLLGTLGGCIVFPRDEQLERQEARDTNDFIRNANVDETDGRL